MTKSKAKNQKRSRRTSIPADLMNRLRAIASIKFELVQNPSNTDVMEATVSFLEDDNTPKIAESINSLGATMQWFTSQIDKLKAENEKIKQERNQAIHSVEQDRISDDDTLQELEGLRQENQSLRSELQQFHQLKQLLGGNEGNNDRALVIDRASPIDSGNSIEQTPVAKGRRRSHIAPEALKDIDQAISLIINWNDQGDRTFEEKWYISFPALQELLRSSGRTASQPRVKAALDNRREEINQHHDKHGLSQKHNARHQGGITDVMTLEG